MDTNYQSPSAVSEMAAELAEVQTVPVEGEFKVDETNVIKTSQSRIEAGYVQFSLSAAANITWWKGIKVFDSKGAMISLLVTQDQDRGPKPSQTFMRSSFSEDKIKVEIWKAKFLGVHTHMATVYFKTAECVGKCTDLRWMND